MIDYYLLTKPKIILGNLITITAGFLLGSNGNFNIKVFSMTLIAMVLIMASSCVFNNYINRHLDKTMTRTKKRALVTGVISSSQALLFGSTLGLVGFIMLFVFTNPLTVLMAGIGFFVYVVLYSGWKAQTIYATAIGSIAGAIPPVVGYCAVSNQFDSGAFIFFMMLVLWQMPHFFSIAMMHLDDYTAAKIPVLPVMRGVVRTKIHMLIYIAAFTVASMMLTLMGYTGYLYLSVTTIVSLYWLYVSLQGFDLKGLISDQQWSRKMLYLSLLVINAICFIIPLEIAFDHFSKFMLNG